MPSDAPESLITGAMVGGGESREHIEYNAHTQVLVPILQDAVLIATVLIVIAGLFLLGGGLLHVARMCETGWDLALWAILISLGLLAVVGCIGAIIRKAASVTAWQPPSWFPVVVYLLGIVWIMALLNLIRVADGEWTIWDTTRIAASLALILGVPFLTYRFFRELLNPKYPPSPTTDMLLEYIRSKINAQEPERVMVRSPIPYRTNSHRGEIDWQRPEEPQLAPIAATVVDDDFVDLVALVQRASTHGWARDRHVRRPRLRLPSGRLLTRPLYDLLVDLAADPWRLIRKSGSPGQSPEWLIDPDAAITMLETVYRAQFDADGQILPIVDPAGRQATRQAGTQEQ